jgi:diacylglycerol kinase family enzyme
VGDVRARIIDNPWSFRGPFPVHRVLPVFQEAGWTVDAVHRDRRLSARHQVERALDDGCQLVIGAGGDGTLRDIATVLAGRDVPLAVLPGGTANLWAHELGVAGSPEHAARAIVTGDDRAMDMGRLWHGERSVRFMMIAGIGADGLILERTDPRLKRILGPAAIALGVAFALPALRPVDVVVRVDGRVAWAGPIAQAIVANSRLYADVVRPAPEATVDDGLLDVTLVPFGEPGALVSAAVWLATRREPGDSLPRFRGAEVEIDCASALPLEVDGSLVRRPSERVTYRLTVEPGVLLVRVPRAYRGPLFRVPPAEVRTFEASA